MAVVGVEAPDLAHKRHLREGFFRLVALAATEEGMGLLDMTHGDCERVLRRALGMLAEEEEERRPYRELLADVGLSWQEIAESRRRLEEVLRRGGSIVPR